MLEYKFISKESGLAISLEDVKTWLRVDGTDDDALITQLIGAATNLAEKYTNRDFITATYEGYNCSAYDHMLLEKGSFQSVEAVEFYENDAYVVQTGYIVKHAGVFGEICEFDQVSSGDCNNVKITFKVGYGDTSADIPEGVKIALCMLVAFMYENRGDCPKSDSMILRAFDAFKIPRFA